MELLIRNKYKTKLNKNELINNGFRFSKFLSGIDDEIYCHNFSILKYKNQVVIHGQILVNIKTKEVKINCYDTCTNKLYYPFYASHVSSCYSLMLNKINKYFKKEFKKNKIYKKGLLW